ncbi:hypothetical protein BGZ65_005842 [Modicella reniformis]|uniref:F-box domain-containing protein n=1 Tax=Modicella reniformis TaxID=1440133 RepID=A0A9P6MB18_9FUNG|nr:hypothetical protein BGZ65_005842 [Modicella reniformis]
MDHALNLPEIAYQVARYLDARDIVACSMVSRSLYKSIYPLHKFVLITTGELSHPRSVYETLLVHLRRLETLELDNVDFELSWPRPRTRYTANNSQTVPALPPPPSPPTALLVRFPRLKEQKSAHRQIKRLIMQCPTLDWSIRNKSLTVELRELLEAGTWSYLESISIASHANIVSDDQYCELLEASKRPLRRFEVRRQPIGEATFDVLRTLHFAGMDTIEHKSLNVSAQDILKSNAWVCVGLQELVMFIDMGFPDNAQNRRFSKEEIGQCRLE